MNFKHYTNEKIIKPLVGFLKQGITPRKLALTIALGVVIGVIPVLGSTTLLCALLAFVFRLNIAVIQLANYIVYPLQLILFIPFIKTGVYFFGDKPFSYSMDQIMAMLEKNFLLVLEEIGMANLMGVGVWVLAVLPLFLIVYKLTYVAAKRLS